VVSNAQFYTPEAFPALVRQTLAELGFAHDLQFYSYQHGRAKPGEALYRLAAASLQRRGILTERALYVGNDMRNDIAPAARLGFRTALFAGDARSLRRREGDPLCAGVVPDLVVTDLIDLLHCV
jgi:putative hydrolase of the HAD superfamily